MEDTLVDDRNYAWCERCKRQTPQCQFEGHNPADIRCLVCVGAANRAGTVCRFCYQGEDVIGPNVR